MGDDGVALLVVVAAAYKGDGVGWAEPNMSGCGRIYKDWWVGEWDGWRRCACVVFSSGHHDNEQAGSGSGDGVDQTTKVRPSCDTDDVVNAMGGEVSEKIGKTPCQPRTVQRSVPEMGRGG